MQQKNPEALAKSLEAFSKGGNTIVQEVKHEVVDFEIDPRAPSQASLGSTDDI